MVDLNKASAFCETVGLDLITISCAEDSETVLNAIDEKDVPFLDFLIECELKQCVSHTLVQQYVTQIWFGELKWEEWKFILLFLVAFLFPPLWIYLSLPFKNRHSHIPIIKFICRLISHLYLILFLCLTVVVPWRYPAADLTPHWYEYCLFTWITGILLSEVSHEGDRNGLSWFPTIVVILALLAEMLHLVALGYNGPQRINIIFVRNQLLAAALTLCVLQFLQFLSIHRLFGPWGVIIAHLVVDVTRFLLILTIFFVSFVLQMTAIHKPLYEDENSYKTAKTSPGLLTIVESLFFGLFGLTGQKDFKPGEPERNATGAVTMTKVIFGIYNILCIIVLINLLIAMMSDTYQRIQEQSDVEWKFGRAKLIRNMERQTNNPSPINLFTILTRIFKMLCKRRCRCRVSEIASEQRCNDDDPDQHQARRKSFFRGKQCSGEEFNLEFTGSERSLIFSVVDWRVIVDKYMESKGEGSQTAKMTSKRPSSKTLPTSSRGYVNKGMSLTELVGNTVTRIEVVNSMRV